MMESHECMESSFDAISAECKAATDWSTIRELQLYSKSFEPPHKRNDCASSCSICNPRSRQDHTYIDLHWLLERYEFDISFTCSILRIFKEQGANHMARLLKAASENNEAVSFHAVISSSMTLAL